MVGRVVADADSVQRRKAAAGGDQAVEVAKGVARFDEIDAVPLERLFDDELAPNAS